MVLDPQLRAKIPKCIIVELLSVVKDEHSRYPVPANNISPNKTSNVLLRDSGWSFCLYLLCEIIDANYEELQLPDCCWEGAYYI